MKIVNLSVIIYIGLVLNDIVQIKFESILQYTNFIGV